jgi:hypothetical protein
MGCVLQNWGSQTHDDVLIALVDRMKPNGADWTAVVASLRPKGYASTESALV